MEKTIDSDTDVNIEFYKTGKSFFQKSIGKLEVQTLLTGSMKDEYCEHLDRIYLELKNKNSKINIHLFEKGFHPAMLTNKNNFFELISEKLNKTLPTKHR